jgi:hypothetical protein
MPGLMALYKSPKSMLLMNFRKSVGDFFTLVGVLKKGVELLLMDELEGARGKELWLERHLKRVVI